MAGSAALLTWPGWRAARRTRAHEIAADEAGSAEHRDSAGHDLFPQHSPEIARAMHYRRPTSLVQRVSSAILLTDFVLTST